MKKIIIKMNKEKKPTIIKETVEDRKERIKYASTMRTKVIQNKKHTNRSQRKVQDRKEFDI